MSSLHWAHTHRQQLNALGFYDDEPVRPKATLNTVTLEIDEDDDLLPLRRSNANDSSSSQFSDSSDDDDDRVSVEPRIKKAEDRLLQNHAPSRVLSQYHGLVSEGSLHAHKTGMCMIEQLCRVLRGLVRAYCLSLSALWNVVAYLFILSLRVCTFPA